MTSVLTSGAALSPPPLSQKVEDDNGLWYVTDLASESGTYVASPARPSVPLTWHRLSPGMRRRVHSGDFVALGAGENVVFRIKNGLPEALGITTMEEAAAQLAAAAV